MDSFFIQSTDYSQTFISKAEIRFNKYIACVFDSIPDFLVFFELVECFDQINHKWTCHETLNLFLMILRIVIEVGHIKDDI